MSIKELVDALADAGYAEAIEFRHLVEDISSKCVIINNTKEADDE